jgi:hypothetical protein
MVRRRTQFYLTLCRIQRTKYRIASADTKLPYTPNYFIIFQSRRPIWSVARRYLAKGPAELYTHAWVKRWKRVDSENPHSPGFEGAYIEILFTIAQLHV